MESLNRLFEHMTWADKRTLKALRSMPEPPSQAVDLYSHLLAAEHVWLCRIENRIAGYDIWPKLSLADCEQLASRNHGEFAALLGRSNDEALRAPIEYANSSGKRFSTALRDILLHVTHHGMYHRGQVALLVRAAGGKPVATDFIAFVRE
jgi:uncharacterized damage-inducible protein DinB